MSSTDTGRPGASPGRQGLGLSLLDIATAQLMIVLDDAIANIASPSIQRELAGLTRSARATTSRPSAV